MFQRLLVLILIGTIIIFSSGCPVDPVEGEGEPSEGEIEGELEGEMEGEPLYEGEPIEGESEGENEGEDPLTELLESLEQEVYVQINEERIAAGLSALFLDKSVREVARTHSQDMADNNFFAHVNLEGVGPAERMLQAGINFRYFGENLAYTYGFSDPVSWIIDGWMESDGHRRNILDRNFTHTGIGVKRDAKGAFYFSQEFTGY